MSTDTPESEGVMPLARKLGEKLGGEPWAMPIERLPLTQSSVRALNPKVWPADVWEQMQRIARGEEP